MDVTIKAYDSNANKVESITLYNTNSQDEALRYAHHMSNLWLQRDDISYTIIVKQKEDTGE